MIFLRGFIHCDPHPGNVLVRAGEAGKAEIVLLDHGLYTVRWKTDYSVCMYYSDIKHYRKGDSLLPLVATD